MYPSSMPVVTIFSLLGLGMMWRNWRSILIRLLSEHSRVGISDVHLSGGVTLHKPKFPLYQMAKMAKQAENAAKANEEQGNRQREK